MRVGRIGFLAKTPLLLALVALALVMGACGDSDNKSAGTSSGTSQAPEREPTGTPIVVGSVATCSGPLASALGGACPTIQAWAKGVNANGGINGHPVKVIVKDDRGVPEKSLAQVRELVEKDKVMAIVGEFSVVDVVWADYIESKGIPVVGSATYEPIFLTHPDFFLSGANVLAIQYSFAALAKQANAPKIALLSCAEAPVCKTNLASIRKANELYGLGVEIVYSAAISATAPNYTAQCLAAKEKGAESLLPISGGAIVERVVNDCAKQGYKPKILTPNGAINPKLAQNPNFEGAVSPSPNAPLPDTSLPAMKELRAALEKFGPEVSQSSEQWNSSVVQVWAGGRLFQAAAKAGNIGPDSTPDDVKKGLYALKDEDLGGLFQPVSFKPGEVAKPRCIFVLGIKGGEVIAPQGLKQICIPGTDEQYEEFRKAVAG